MPPSVPADNLRQAREVRDGAKNLIAFPDVAIKSDHARVPSFGKIGILVVDEVKVEGHQDLASLPTIGEVILIGPPYQSSLGGSFCSDPEFSKDPLDETVDRFIKGRLVEIVALPRPTECAAKAFSEYRGSRTGEQGDHA